MMQRVSVMMGGKKPHAQIGPTEPKPEQRVAAPDYAPKKNTAKNWASRKTVAFRGARQSMIKREVESRIEKIEEKNNESKDKFGKTKKSVMLHDKQLLEMLQAIYKHTPPADAVRHLELPPEIPADQADVYINKYQEYMEQRDGNIQRARKNVQYYREFDKNKSGRLEAEEFKALLRAQHQELPTIMIACKRDDLSAAEKKYNENLEKLHERNVFGDDLLEGEYERAMELFSIPPQKYKSGVALQVFEDEEKLDRLWILLDKWRFQNAIVQKEQADWKCCFCMASCLTGSG